MGFAALNKAEAPWKLPLLSVCLFVCAFLSVMCHDKKACGECKGKIQSFVRHVDMGNWHDTSSSHPRCDGLEDAFCSPVALCHYVYIAGNRVLVLWNQF